MLSNSCASDVYPVRVQMEAHSWQAFLYLENLLREAGEMGQSVKCLPNKHKDLSSNPQHTVT